MDSPSSTSARSLLTDIRRLKNLPQEHGEDPIAAFNARTEQTVAELREDYMRQQEVTE